MNMSTNVTTSNGLRFRFGLSLINILNALFSSILAILPFFDLFGSSQSDLVQSKEVDDIIIGAGCAHSFCATQNTVPSKVYHMFCPFLSPKHLILGTPHSYFFWKKKLWESIVWALAVGISQSCVMGGVEVSCSNYYVINFFWPNKIWLWRAK